MKSPHKLSLYNRAFTLVELLAAIVVLTILLLLLAQLMSLSSQTATEGRKQVDDFTKARLALDVCLQDIAAGVFRNDLASFLDDNGNYSNTFYTRRLSPGGDRALSVVDYKLDANTGSLLRASIPIMWTDKSALGFNNTTSIPRYQDIQTITPSPYDDIADGVVGLQFYFLDSSGHYHTNYSTECTTITVALAVIDQASLNILTQTGKLVQLENTFSTQSSINKSYGTYWEEQIAAVNFFDAYPKQLRTGLRIFERSIPIP